MTPTRNATEHLWRFRVALGFLAICVSGLIGRIIDLNIIHHQFLQHQGDIRTLRTITIPSYRGIITDRNGEPLAISTPVFGIWANPQSFDTTNTIFQQFAKLINIPEKVISEKLQKNAHREFIYLKRGVDPDTAHQIKDLNIKGLYLEKEYHRYYPAGEATAHILGFTNIDDQGQEGLELAYNEWLQGTPGLKRILRDRYGNTVSEVNIIKQPVPGQNLALSIDNRIQYMAYRELVNGIQEFDARSGSIVILNIHTGEILAMVNSPSYNPNAPIKNNISRFRNQAVTDLFEPGSTIKPIAMASALLSGKYNINSTIDTSPGYWMVEGKRIVDEHNNGIINLKRILQVSSNVGMSKITLSLPANAVWELLHNLGFGQTTTSGFPGESAGVLTKRSFQSAFVRATLSFGYGLSVTTLQLAHAYATLANKGVAIPVSLLKIAQAPQGEQIINSRVSQEILSMLEAVLQEGGTATAARIPGYRVTGKTGTARILGPHGYEKNHHNSIFVGIAPASNPQLVVAVILRDPLKKSYYGGFVAGPVFSQVMGETLRMLNIPPDDLT